MILAVRACIALFGITSRARQTHRTTEPWGSASQWGFAIWRASIDGYDENVVPIGLPVTTPEDALDTACGLYVGDRIPWPPRANPIGQ